MGTMRKMVATASSLLFVGVLGVGVAFAHGGRSRDDRMDSGEFRDMMTSHPEFAATYAKGGDANTCEADVKDTAGKLFGHFFINGDCQ